MGDIPAETMVLKASPISTESQAASAPPPIEPVVAAIKEHKPDLVFAAHVETASGIMLPADSQRPVAAAVHSRGGLFVLYCIDSGTTWVDMPARGEVGFVGA